MPPTGHDQKIWAVVAGRMGSERLPGKTMAPLCDRPVLQHVIDRLSVVHRLDGVIVATTTASPDDVISDWASAADVPVHRGSSTDVMRRMIDAARSVDADVIVRVTGDCPLIDPDVVEAVVLQYIADTPDYACNFLDGPQFPRGQEVEAFSLHRLAELEPQINARRDREHVTTVFYENPQRFRLVGVKAPEGQRRPELRLTLDTAEDYALISAIFSELYPGNHVFRLPEVIALLDRRADLVSLNAHIEQRSP